MSEIPADNLPLNNMNTERQLNQGAIPIDQAQVEKATQEARGRLGLTLENIPPIKGGAGWLYDSPEQLGAIKSPELQRVVKVLELTPPDLLTDDILKRRYFQIQDLVIEGKADSADSESILRKIHARLNPEAEAERVKAEELKKLEEEQARRERDERAQKDRETHNYTNGYIIKKELIKAKSTLPSLGEQADEVIEPVSNILAAVIKKLEEDLPDDPSITWLVPAIRIPSKLRESTEPMETSTQTTYSKPPVYIHLTNKYLVDPSEGRSPAPLTHTSTDIFGSWKNDVWRITLDYDDSVNGHGKSLKTLKLDAGRGAVIINRGESPDMTTIAPVLDSLQNRLSS